MSQDHEQSQRPAFVSEDAATAYKQVLAGARASQSPDPIPNRYPWHCRLAVNELLQMANQLQCAKPTNPIVVRLLTGTLAKNVYEPGLISKLGDFLGAGGKIKILVWNTVEDFRKSYPQNSPLFGFYSAPGFELKISGTREMGNQLRHFLTIGGVAFRMEAPHQYFDSGNFNDFEPDIPAQICFNNPKTTASLVDFFETIWKSIPESTLSATGNFAG